MTFSPTIAVTIFLAGLTLGALNFWALHRTVQKAVRSPQPVRIFLLSLLLRMALLLPPLSLLVRHNPLYLLTALVGFILARKVVVHLTQRAQKGS